MSETYPKTLEQCFNEKLKHWTSRPIATVTITLNNFFFNITHLLSTCAHMIKTKVNSICLRPNIGLGTNFRQVSCCCNGKHRKSSLLISNENFLSKTFWYFKDDTTPLILASASGHLNCVVELLEQGANPNSKRVVCNEHSINLPRLL